MDSRGVVDRLASCWRDCGVESGDFLLVHSSISRTLRHLKAAGEPSSPEVLLDSFLEAVGPEGTLLFPLFNFDFTQGHAFDIRSTPSQMGALTEAARARRDVVRTGHPIYSFAALGKQAGLFKGLANLSGYGPDSPFATLHELRGKVAVLDLPDQHSMTFYHYVEESRGVDYRFHKWFEGEYVDAAGVGSIRRFSIFVRNTDAGVRTCVDPMGELLWERGLYRGDRPSTGAGLRTIEAKALFDAVREVIDSGRAKGLLYELE
jgi:aminoglycoside 3-N-acetyltransferase